MGIVFKNNAKTTLASNLSNSATSASVTDGSVFPSLGAGEFFIVTFDDGTNNEVCKCTARSSNTLTIVRAQEGSSARAFNSGDGAEGRVTAGVLESIQENIAAKSANQTVYNATAASSATAYDIGVNPGVEANAMVFLDGVMQHHDTFSFSGSTLTFDAAPTDGTKIEVIVDNLINLQSSNLTVDTFTATSGQTAFTLSDAPGGESNVIAFVEGVFQNQSSFSLSSNTLTFDTGVVVGRAVTVYIINPVNIGTPSDSTVTSAKLSGNITLPGSLTVGSHDVAFDSPTFVVDNSNSRVGLGTASPTVPVDIVGEVKTSSHINIGGNLVKASGDLTLDSAGDIILDADGDDWKFHEGGNAVFEIKHESHGVDFLLNTGDEDWRFKGSDSGSTITALHLDMSEAGKAVFNAGATFANDISITSTGASISLIDSDNNPDYQIKNGNGAFRIIDTTNSVDIFNHSATGNLTIDVAGDINLSADDNGAIHLYDGSLHYGSLLEENSNFLIQSMVQDEDILFKGNDGGSVITALTLDMSKAGEATFNSNVVSGGSVQAQLTGYFITENTTNAFSIASNGANGFLKIRDEYNSADRLTILNDGKVGIGTTSPTRPLQIQLTEGAASDFQTNLDIKRNWSSGSSTDRYTGFTISDYNSINAGIYANRPSSHANYESDLNFYTNSGSSNLDPSVSLTQKMTILANGKVGIGTTSPDVLIEVVNSDPRLRLRDNTAGGGADNGGIVEFMGHHAGSSDGSRMFAQIKGLKQNSTGGDTHGYLAFHTNQGAASTTEGMRLNHDGKLTVGSTPTQSNGVIEANYSGNAFTLWLTATGQNYLGFESTETGGQAWSFRTAGSGNYGSANGDLLFINGTGGEFMRMDQSAATVNGDFNDTSDIGLKENITDTTDGLTKLLQLQPRKFDWKDEVKRNNVNGFIAQEVETVLPDEVIGDDYDEKNPQHGHKAINTSGLLAVAVKAIQELTTKLETAEARIKTLEDA